MSKSNKEKYKIKIEFNLEFHNPLVKKLVDPDQFGQLSESRSSNNWYESWVFPKTAIRKAITLLLVNEGITLYRFDDDPNDPSWESNAGIYETYPKSIKVKVTKNRKNNGTKRKLRNKKT